MKKTAGSFYFVGSGSGLCWKVGSGSKPDRIRNTVQQADGTAELQYGMQQSLYNLLGTKLCILF